jgi:ATP-dependent Clp protease adaptor protein ClpS
MTNRMLRGVGRSDQRGSPAAAAGDPYPDPRWPRRGPREDHGAVPTAAPVEVEEPTGDVDVRPDLPWIVIVWNDPINLMSYVVFVFQKLFGYSREKATSLMLDVHQKGRAVVSSGSREKAELDVFRLHEHGLWATMQREDA